MNIDKAIKQYNGKSSYHVYYLVKGSVVIYVGSSRHISNRLVTHKSSDMDFDSVRVDECASCVAMYNLESSSIVRLNPKHNKALPSNDDYKKTTECIALASKVISDLVKELPTCFSRSMSTHIETKVYDEFISSVDEFAINKIAEIIKSLEDES